MLLNGSDPSDFLGDGSCSPPGSPHAGPPSPGPAPHKEPTGHGPVPVPVRAHTGPGDRRVGSPGWAQCPQGGLGVPGPSHRVCSQLQSRITSGFPTRTAAAQPSVGAGGQIPPKERSCDRAPYRARTGGCRRVPSPVCASPQRRGRAAQLGSQRRTQARRGGRGRRRGRRLFKLAVRAGPPRPGQRGPLSARRGRAAPGTAPLAAGPSSTQHGARRARPRAVRGPRRAPRGEPGSAAASRPPQPASRPPWPPAEPSGAEPSGAAVPGSGRCLAAPRERGQRAACPCARSCPPSSSRSGDERDPRRGSRRLDRQPRWCPCSPCPSSWSRASSSS